MRLKRSHENEACMMDCTDAHADLFIGGTTRPTGSCAQLADAVLSYWCPCCLIEPWRLLEEIQAANKKLFERGNQRDSGPARLDTANSFQVGGICLTPETEK